MCPGQSDSKPCENTEPIFNSQFSIFNWHERSLRIFILLRLPARDLSDLTDLNLTQKPQKPQKEIACI